MSARTRAWLALLAASCTGDDLHERDSCAEDDPFAIQIDVQVPSELAARGVTVHWADRPPPGGVMAPPTFGVASLRRGFATRDEAAAFDTPFVVRVGGAEAARAEVRLSACDFVTALGYEPQDRRQLVVRYHLKSDTVLEAASILSYSPQTACTATAVPDPGGGLVAPECVGDARSLGVFVTAAPPLRPTALLVDDDPVVPRMIAPWGDGALLLFVIDTPLGQPAAAVQHTLRVVQGGATSGALNLRFDRCLEMLGSHPADDLRYQRLSLALDGETLSVDDTADVTCMFADGTLIIGVP